ncbi:MAG: DUF4830 domain-containing protein, partial [Clostridiales bacterium]|nr:DUF4830 domain-containing protein [Clostridiales bacterium]
MFVLSVKAEKKRLLIGLAAALLAITLLAVAFSLQGGGVPDIPGETNDQRVVFLQQYGWEVEEEPIDVQEVILPEEFNDVYTNYNAVQKTQNMVLSYQLLSIGVDEMPVRKKAPEDLTAKKALALEVIDRLKKEYPDAGCTLDYDHAWQLLVSVRLAAQCTDARVNIVVEDLFAKYP